MRKNKRNKRRRNHRGNGIGAGKLALAIATPIVFIGAGATILFKVTGEEKPDDAFCYIRDTQNETAVFLDNSLRKLSPAQLRDYHTGFTEAYDAAPPNTRIMVFSTASDVSGSLASPVYTQCKPASNMTEQAAINAPEKPAPYLVRHAEKARVAYSKAVNKILDDVRDEEHVAGTSPILEQLRTISQYRGFQGTARSLTVITDGIQNSAIGRFCAKAGAMPPFNSFTKREDYDLSIKPHSYAGADVSLLMVESLGLPSSHYPHCTNTELQQWWHDYFTHNGASQVKLTPLRYLGGDV